MKAKVDNAVSALTLKTNSPPVTDPDPVPPVVDPNLAPQTADPAPETAPPVPVPVLAL